jgi:hypothetical protein
MKYNFDLAMSAMVSDQVVQEIIVREVEQQVGRKVNKITPVITDGKYTGYQVFFDYHSEVRQPYVPTTEFIKQTYSGE